MTISCMQTVLMLIGLDTLQEIVAVMVLWFFSSIEIDDLKEKLKMATLVSSSNSSGKKSKSKRRVSCSSQTQVNMLPARHLFNATVNSVKESSQKNCSSSQETPEACSIIYSLLLIQLFSSYQF